MFAYLDKGNLNFAAIELNPHLGLNAGKLCTAAATAALHWAAAQVACEHQRCSGAAIQWYPANNVQCMMAKAAAGGQKRLQAALVTPIAAA
jgi:hypothetical protein